MNNPLKFRYVSLTALCATLGFASLASAQTTVTTAPVGAITQTVAAGTGTGTFTFLGFPLVKASAWQGGLASASGTTLTASDNSLTASAFSAVPHYVIVTEGTNAGLMVDVVGNSTNTINLAEDITGLISNTDKISVRPHSTLGNLFGITNSAGLGAAGSVSTADEIRIFNPTTQAFVTYYYKNTGLGGTGWRSTTSTSSNRANDIIYPEQSIIVLRKQNSSLAILTTGEVYPGAMKLTVENGYVWVINTTPIATTLSSLGFYTGSTTGLSGSNAISSADEVRRWTGSSWESFYFKSSGLGGTGWRTAASSSLDRSSQIITPGEALIIYRKTTPLLVTRPAYTVSF